MSKYQEESFFKPVLSTLGLIASFLAAVTPLFPVASVSNYFLDKRLASPSSIMAVILGLITSWTVFSFYNYLEWRFGSKMAGEYSVPRLTMGPSKIIWFLSFTSVVIFASFFVVPNSLIQAVLYILFFCNIIFIFSFLVTLTKFRYEYLASKDSEAEVIFRTLEKNRIISPGISIYSNEPITDVERQEHDIRNFGFLKKVRLETVVQEKEYIVVVMSDDYRELIKVIKKKKI